MGLSSPGRQVIERSVRVRPTHLPFATPIEHQAEFTPSIRSRTSSFLVWEKATWLMIRNLSSGETLSCLTGLRAFFATGIRHHRARLSHIAAMRLEHGQMPKGQILRFGFTPVLLLGCRLDLVVFWH